MHFMAISSGTVLNEQYMWRFLCHIDWVGYLFTKNEHWDPSFLWSSTNMTAFTLFGSKTPFDRISNKTHPPFPPVHFDPGEPWCQIAFKIIAGFDRVGYLHLQIEKLGKYTYMCIVCIVHALHTAYIHAHCTTFNKFLFSQNLQIPNPPPEFSESVHNYLLLKWNNLCNVRSHTQFAI